MSDKKNTFNAQEVRAHFLETVTDFFSNNGEDICRIKSGAIAMPTLDSEGNEGWVSITVSVPTGSADEPFDGYEQAENYAFECEKRAAKKAADAEKRAKKKARDAAAREEKRRIREAKKLEREAAKAEAKESEEAGE